MKHFVCSNESPIVKTRQGKLRGFKWGDVYQFRGVRYARSERFCMPQPIEHWEGIREAQIYGYTSKVMEPYRMDDALIVPHRYWHLSEDCQNLNIWTTSLSATDRKPVMVWLHGGGFSNGSAIEHVDYDGENLARNGDVVVVTVNHRLNIIGYMDMSSFDDEKYHNSGNAGNADIVAALIWIHENIAVFGGDPQNVTIFGQSGGGGKVSSLLQTPAAAGLFHKAIIESGIGEMTGRPSMDGRAVALAMLEQLGLEEKDYEQLARIPYEQLANAFEMAKPGLAAAGVELGWGPVPNDWYLGEIGKAGISEHARHIPVIIGSVFAEFVMRHESQPEKLTEEQHREWVISEFGEHADEVISAYREAYPDKPVCYAANVDHCFRAPTVRYCQEWIRQSEAPIYCFLLNYFFPYMGTFPTWHCAEIPFAFYNIDLIEVYGNEDCQKLQREIGGAFAAFAHTGNPNHTAMPHWPPFTAEHPVIMLFDIQSTAKEAHDTKLQAVLDKWKKPLFSSLANGKGKRNVPY